MGTGKLTQSILAVLVRRFFLLARFYGPEPALFNKSFELNDIELMK